MCRLLLLFVVCCCVMCVVCCCVMFVVCCLLCGVCCVLCVRACAHAICASWREFECAGVCVCVCLCVCVNGLTTEAIPPVFQTCTLQNHKNHQNVVERGTIPKFYIVQELFLFC